MGHIICITARKDGTGKTTTAVNLSAAFAIAEKRTLLVDCDPIGHATTGLGFNKIQSKSCLYQGMIGKKPLSELIIKRGAGFPDLVPGGSDLYKFPTGAGSKKEFILRYLLEEVKNRYDYIVIDTPQTPIMLLINAYIAAEFLLITIPCEYLELSGFDYLFDTFRMIKTGFSLKYNIVGILLTKIDIDEKISRLIDKKLRDHFKNIVFKTTIPMNSDLRNSPAYGKPVFLTDIKSQGARSYLNLAGEIMGKYP